LTFFFRQRLIKSFKEFRGIAIFDVENNRVIDEGITNPPPRLPEKSEESSASVGSFSKTAFAASRTRDQQHALDALSSLSTSKTPIVITADRGRGKSAALGIAAAEFAESHNDVLVTSPHHRNVKAVFTHAVEVLNAKTDCVFTQDTEQKKINLEEAGSITYLPPDQATSESPDILFVDEAAAIGLPLLRQFLTVDHVAFSTTTHGYEGTGQRFSVTFQPELTERRGDVTEVRLEEPIRYAPTDPVEPWLFHTTLLNANPPPAQTVQDATPDAVQYKVLHPAQLSENEAVLRQVYGLLNQAHYKTQPSDLVRLLDAPNLIVRALFHNGFVVSVALLAREGGFTEETQEAIFAGERIRGNVIPDLLTSQLRDKSAGAETGLRVVRLATHSARRGAGLGSYLLQSIQEEFSGNIDWLGTCFSASADLVSFWNTNGFDAVHLSIRRNQTTGAHSVVMLREISERGDELCSRHSGWFANRFLGLVTGAYRTIHPDVLKAVIRSVNTTVRFEISKRDRRYLSGTINGAGTYDHNPLPFRKLGLNYFLNTDKPRLDAEDERFIILRLLQDTPWEPASGFVSFQSDREYNKHIRVVSKKLLAIEGV
jgi:tRNA(Met) cytidine acetyltransferase